MISIRKIKKFVNFIVFYPEKCIHYYNAGRVLTDETAEKLNYGISASRNFKDSIGTIRKFVEEKRVSVDSFSLK